VKYAATDRGVRHFAILYPNDFSGREMKESFEREVQRQGGTMAMTGAMQRQRTFVMKSDRLPGYRRWRSRMKPGQVDNDPSTHDVGFEALFLPTEPDGSPGGSAAFLLHVTGVLLLEPALGIT